jgi:hypothetical protein
MYSSRWVEPSMPKFTSAARYGALDNVKPRFGVLYETQDFDVFESPSWLKVRDGAPKEDEDMLSALPIVDVRTCQTLYDSGALPGRTSYLLSMTMAPLAGQEEDFLRWCEENHQGKMATTPGWRRTTRYKVDKSVLSGRGQDSKHNDSPTYMTLYGTLCRANQLENIMSSG